jgi:hypothetical protein
LRRSLITKIQPSKDKSGEKIKFIVDNNPSPGHYRADESFVSTQLKKPTFLISKTKLLSLAELTIREKKDIPGVGQYSFDNAFNKTTRGASRGWK